MYSLKAPWVGRTFAQAKPNASGGRKSRVRIPKEERKAMVESFIKKHQKQNSGNFPSLSLTHREVGGSFYTIREIVREIIQENRVLGPAGSILEKKGNAWEPEQSQSDSILMEPAVPPLTMHQNGSHFTTGRKQSMTEEFELFPSSFSSESGGNKNINGSEVGQKEKDSNMLVCRELEASKPFQENTLRQASSSSISNISKVPLPVSSNENHVLEHDLGMQERMEKLHGSFSGKPGDQGLENGKCIDGIHLDVDDKDREMGEIICKEPKATKPVEVEKIVEETATTMSEAVNIPANVSGIVDTVTDISASVTVETFPLIDLSDGKSTHSENFCEAAKGIETDSMTSEANSRSAKALSLEENSSTASAITDATIVEGFVGQLENKVSDPLEKRVGDNFVNPESINAGCTNTNGSIALDALAGNAVELQESNNGIWTSQTTEKNQPVSNNEPRSAEKEITKIDNKASHAGNESTASGEATMKQGKEDAPDNSISQMESSNAALDRIKPQSWKSASKNIAGETNPLLAALKSFLTAFIKFWSE